jgi:hypothetical protein
VDIPVDTSGRGRTPEGVTRRHRPMLLPGLRPLWRTSRAVQLGTDPARAVVLELADPSAGRLLYLLDGSRTEHALLKEAARLGMSEADARTLLQDLKDRGLVIAADGLLPAGGARARSPHARRHLAPTRRAAGGDQRPWPASPPGRAGPSRGRCRAGRGPGHVAAAASPGRRPTGTRSERLVARRDHVRPAARGDDAPAVVDLGTRGRGDPRPARTRPPGTVPALLGPAPNRSRPGLATNTVPAARRVPVPPPTPPRPTP